MNNTVSEFLKAHNQHPDQMVIDDIVKEFLKEMSLGLNGEKSSLMMIPTYLSTQGNVPQNIPAVTIDAGGTNLRLAVVTFTPEGVKVEKFSKQKMLGVEKPLSKEEFLEELAQLIIPLLDSTDKVGFCFSFAAEILPNKDGKVVGVSKEVVINGIEGTVLGEELNRTIKAHGIEKDVKFVILNDTVSTLLGGPAITAKEKVDGQIGLILGTGTNTAYSEKCENIRKIDAKGEKMIINMESGDFNKITLGDYDHIVDRTSMKEGYHVYEKMISGVYLGNIIGYTLKGAAEEGLFSPQNTFRNLPLFGMTKVDEFLREPYGDSEIAKACGCEEDVDIAYQICDAAIERASKLVTANLAACIVQMDGGKTISAPCRIVVEGSTFHKAYSYKEKIDYFMKEYVNKNLHRYYAFTSGDDVNLAGSAIAALLNL